MRKPDRSGNISGAQASSRPPELEDWLNRRVYHPLSRRLAFALRHTFVTPNIVSVMGGAMVGVAAVFYLQGGGLIWALLGLLAHMSWHVLDGADGDLARLTGRESAFGEMIDGACDYLGHIVLYIALASILADQIGQIGWPLMIVAGFARVPQAAYFETQRRQYQWWVYRKPWLRLEPGESASGRGPVPVLARAYMRLSNLFATGGARLDTCLAAVSQERRERAAALVRQRMSQFISRLSPLSANYRTVVIGAAMIAEVPIAIVIFELFLLTGYMVIAMRISHGLIALTQAELTVEQ